MKLIDIIPDNKLYTVSWEEYGGNEDLYRLSFDTDTSFREMKSNAAEVTVRCSYFSGTKGGFDEDDPCIADIAVIYDDQVYTAGEEYKEKGTVSDVLEFAPLSGKFLFKAKMNYFGDLLYFYCLDMCGGSLENRGLCMLYPKEYMGTESEKRLIKLLDDAAASYSEKLIEAGSPAEIPQKPQKISTEKPETGIKEGIIKTAGVIKLIRVIVLLAVLIILGCFVIYDKIKDDDSVHHLVQLRGDEEILTGFIPEEESRILSAFDVRIPKNEENAHVVTFISGSRNKGITSYIIEIDGVKDKEAFYAANSGRTMGKSVNEADTRESGREYLVTYHERVITAEGKKDKNADAHKKIAELYNEIKEKHGS